MRLLSLEHFLGLFSPIPTNLNTLAKFRKHAKVKTARDIVPLVDYIANKSVSERDRQRRETNTKDPQRALREQGDGGTESDID